MLQIENLFFDLEFPCHFWEKSIPKETPSTDIFYRQREVLGKGERRMGIMRLNPHLINTHTLSNEFLTIHKRILEPRLHLFKTYQVKKE